MKRWTLIIISLILNICAAWAQELQIASVFSSDMVLQQQSEVTIWGTASPNKPVQVRPSWGGKTVTATSGPSGKWSVSFRTPAAGGPFSLTVQSGREKQVLERVYVGEVWIASGQSNMDMPLKGFFNQPVLGSTEEILGSSRKEIHFLNVPTVPSLTAQDGFEGASWVRASPENAGECTAVGWFFAKWLQEYLNVPIGIVNASFSGSNVEAWMPEEACREFTDINLPEADSDVDMSGGNIASTLYNGMLNPVAGFRARGFIWYQGESSIFNIPRFAPATAAMVRHWRSRWGDESMPFYFVQIAPYDYTEWNFFTPPWPEISAYLRDAQYRSLSMIPNSGMAVTLDIGERNCIHPSHKEEVGKRLALMALSRDYGFSGFEAESPVFERMEVDGNRAILHFDKVQNGLTSFGKGLTLFEVSGWNRVFVPAEAWIDGDNGTVVVSSKLVDRPEAVRYAFRNWCTAELFGTGGLPVGSFRTDDWD